MDLLSKLLKEMINTRASDLFLSTGAVPIFRINGKLRPVNLPRWQQAEPSKWLN